MIDIDPQTGIIETFSKDAITGKIHIHKQQDVNPFLQFNQNEMNNQIFKALHYYEYNKKLT